MKDYSGDLSIVPLFPSGCFFKWLYSNTWYSLSFINRNTDLVHNCRRSQMLCDIFGGQKITAYLRRHVVAKIMSWLPICNEYSCWKSLKKSFDRFQYKRLFIKIPIPVIQYLLLENGLFNASWHRQALLNHLNQKSETDIFPTIYVGKYIYVWVFAKYKYVHNKPCSCPCSCT